MTNKQKIQRQGILTEAHLLHEKGLNSYAFYKVSCHVTSKDLVQDTFMKTWKYLARGGKIETMKAFLYHILNNLIVDEYRKRKIGSLDVLLDKGFDPSTDFSERFYNILDGEKLLHSIKDMPEKYRKVMNLRYKQDLSLKEISVITGQPKNTIAVQTHRGIEMLKSLYNPLRSLVAFTRNKILQ